MSRGGLRPELSTNEMTVAFDAMCDFLNEHQVGTDVKIDLPSLRRLVTRVRAAPAPQGDAAPLTAAQLGQMGLIRAALAVAAGDLKSQDESTLFDLATNTGLERLLKVLRGVLP